MYIILAKLCDEKKMMLHWIALTHEDYVVVPVIECDIFSEQVTLCFHYTAWIVYRYIAKNLVSSQYRPDRWQRGWKVVRLPDPWRCGREWRERDSQTDRPLLNSPRTLRTSGCHFVPVHRDSCPVGFSWGCIHRWRSEEWQRGLIRYILLALPGRSSEDDELCDQIRNRRNIIWGPFISGFSINGNFTLVQILATWSQRSVAKDATVVSSWYVQIIRAGRFELNFK